MTGWGHLKRKAAAVESCRRGKQLYTEKPMVCDLNAIDTLLEMPAGAETFDFYSGDRQPFLAEGQLAGQRDGYRRLDRVRTAALAAKVNSGVIRLIGNPAGVSLRFLTDSPAIALSVSLGTLVDFPHFALTGIRGVSFYVGSGNARKHIGTAFPRLTPVTTYCSLIRPDVADLPPAEEHDGRQLREWRLYLPLYNDVQALAVGVEAGATICALPSPTSKPVLFYGSSITQGGCASQPGNAYPALLTHWLGVPQINLGFSGSALGEPAMADLIASQDLACLVLDLDYNLSSAEALSAVHEPFYRRVRQARPELPIILMSRPDTDNRVEDSRARRAVIARTHRRARADGDRRIWYVDGRSLFGRCNRDACTVDRSHPNDLGFLRMATRLRPLLGAILHGDR